MSDIPDFQSIMRPLLQSMDDGQVRSSAQIRLTLAAEFGLSAEQQAKLLPSGTQPVFANRTAWASVYLQKAGLLERVSRGQYRITEAGRRVLSNPPDRIDIAYLMQYPEFEEFRTGTRERSGPKEDGQTPAEQLEAAYQELHAELASDLLEKLKECSPAFFERLVVQLLVKMGYGGSVRDAGLAVGRSGDEGIDGIIKEDRLGLDVIYVQAKRWAGTVGRPEIQKFVGALHGRHAKKGVFITTGTFASSALEYARRVDPKVVLIGGTDLAGLMIETGVGVSTQTVYELKRIDLDFFAEE